MSLETVLSELVAAIKENTETMRSFTVAPANVVPITAPAPAPAPAPAAEEKKVKKEKPASEKEEKPAEVAPEPEKEETPAPEPEVEEPAAEDPSTWDDATLKLAINEYCKSRIIAPDSAPFKEAFGAELARLGVDKAAKLSPEQRLGFYQKALTW